MSGHIRVKATHSVAAGRVDDFKKLASEMIGPLSEVAPATGIWLYGDPSDELREAVAPFGANISGHWNGFTR